MDPYFKLLPRDTELVFMRVTDQNAYDSAGRLVVALCQELGAPELFVGSDGNTQSPRRAIERSAGAIADYVRACEEAPEDSPRNVPWIQNRSQGRPDFAFSFMEGFACSRIAAVELMGFGKRAEPFAFSVSPKTLLDVGFDAFGAYRAVAKDLWSSGLFRVQRFHEEWAGRIGGSSGGAPPDLPDNKELRLPALLLEDEYDARLVPDYVGWMNRWDEESVRNLG